MVYDIDVIYRYHKPSFGEVALIGAINEAAAELAKLIREHVPAGREREVARRKLEEATMWAEKGITREPARLEQREFEARVTRSDVDNNE